jgi:peptidoglycan/LPS O-acetylase OafA/YrhL
MATVRRTVVAEPAAAATTVRYDRATEQRWGLDASGVVSLLAGLLYGVMGLIVLIDLGVADFPSEATTQVFNLTQTQIWGGIGIGLGLLLLAGAASYGRGLSTFAGALLLVAGIVVVAALDQLDATLATEEAYGWLAIVSGALVLLAAIAAPTVATRRQRVVDERVDERVVDERVVAERVDQTVI